MECYREYFSESCTQAICDSKEYVCPLLTTEYRSLNSTTVERNYFCTQCHTFSDIARFQT